MFFAGTFPSRNIKRLSFAFTLLPLPLGQRCIFSVDSVFVSHVIFTTALVALLLFKCYLVSIAPDEPSYISL